MIHTTGYATELFDVIAFAWEGEYSLRIQFDDDTERVIDFAPILHGPLWGTLQDMALFRQARLDEEIGTIVWPGGLDIDPTVLHDWPEHVAHIVAKENAGNLRLFGHLRSPKSEHRDSKDSLSSE